VLRAYDGRGPSTKMMEILSRDYDLAASEIPRFVYATTTHADDIARYSRLIIEAAQDGDAVASAILQDAGRELGACVVAVAQRLKIADKEFPVAHVGGAFHAGDLLLSPMKEKVKAAAPRAKIGPPERTPVQGAAMMAIRAAAAPRPSRRG
jgi:N-acetylglucosamine kinase-like BadF-type ATPase